MKIDPRFIQENGPAIFTGNELLVKGALETEGGVHLHTGYPGSPVAGYFDTLENISPLLTEHGVVARMANNEALSVAMVNGAQMAGCRAIAAFKSVGLHVASDALALGVLSGIQADGGGLIVCGDDPWSDSTQVPADSRYLAEHCRLPMVEPSCPQEVKDWVDLSFKLGQAAGIYVGYMMTVNNADGGGTVTCRPNHFPTLSEKQQRTLSYQKDIEPRLEDTVLLPPRTWRRELQLDDQLDRIKAAARRLGLNQILGRPQKGEKVPMGFIASGVAYAYLEHALAELGLTGRFPILKLGVSYPVDEQIVREMAGFCRQLFVIEERRGFVERQVVEALRDLAGEGTAPVEVYGKSFPGGLPGIPSTRGLNPSLLIEHLVPIIKRHPTLPIELTNGNLSEKLTAIQRTATYEVHLPDRTPTFCPGCPHRDSSSVLLEIRQDLLDPDYMMRRHKRGPVDLVCHGDTGCYTMLMFAPNKPLMHNYSGMGLGGATGAGIDPFIDNKQMVFMGDGTFFHSGIAAIGQSLYNGQDITYVILDNKITAMTGHQPHAGVDHDLMGRVTNPIDIERAVQGLVPKNLARDVRIVRIDPADRVRYRRLMEQTILADGVKIVIADKECGITFHRRAKREQRNEIKEKGFLPKSVHMNISTEACEFCLECTTQTGCPGLKVVDTAYGPKMQTDLSTCVNDGACQRIHACPSFEEIEIQRRQPKRMGDEYIALDDLPAPARPIHANQDIWRAYIAGVGGMGIGTATAILTQAGFAMGYDVQFLDKKGLAIRNGGIYSQLVYTRRRAEGQRPVPRTTPSIPYGQADLLLGVDLLEAARAMDPKHPYRAISPERTAAVVNTAKTPTILTLMGQDDFDVEQVERTIQRYTRPDHYAGFNVGDLCERVLDNKLYANIMMLGLAFQKGFLPLTQEVLEDAIRRITGREAERNLRAFHIGRKIAIRPELFVVGTRHTYETPPQTLRRKVNTLEAWYGAEWVGRLIDRQKGKRVAKQFRVLMKQTYRATSGFEVDDEMVRDVIIRAYDCFIWGGLKYAQLYCRKLVQTFHRDDARLGYAATRAVVHNLAKVMLIKDEIYVAALLTSPEKYRADRRRWNVNPANGDRIIYRHHNRPEFVLFGRKIRFEWKSRDWQLRIASSCGWVRKLLPSWHTHEKNHRDHYLNLVDQFGFTSDQDYQRWVAILQTPAPVTGYREVRYPKIQAAIERAEELLKQDPNDFQPPQPKPRSGGGSGPVQEADPSRVSLTVLS